MSIYRIVDHTHSSLRWVLLILFLLAIYRFFMEGYRSSKSPKTMLYGKLTVIVAHIQTLLGLVLYFFLSPKVHFEAAAMKSTFQRFYLVEHISMMLIAIILLTIVWVKGKKKLETASGARYLFYLVYNCFGNYYCGNSMAIPQCTWRRVVLTNLG